MAIQVLARVAATDAYLNVVLDTVLDEQKLKDPRDAGLVTELCYGATRRRMTLDTVLRKFADRSLDTIEDRVLAALRLGVYQLFFMRVPKHAAVGDTVDALKAVGLERAAGFVNAILRRVSELPELPKSDGDEIGRLVYDTSHPAWLVKRWLRQFGPERASAMLAADNDSPPVVIRANTSKVTRDELFAQLTEAGVACRPATLSPLGIVLDSPGRIEELYGYREGLWQVQDEAAQLVTVFAQIPANARVLDACAAPGGKACHLAQTNEVVAIDVHANKLPKIDAESKRLGLRKRLTLERADASKPLPESLGEFDAVLIDAPCTGLGTLRRHPELRYRRQESDIAELSHLQREILEQCSLVVKPGGLLVFAVCSTDTAEGPDQIEMFLRSHPDFTTEPPKGLSALPTWQGHLRTLPGPEGLDGFFAARLRKMY
ncbi:MAG: 16S rRNA (cytosine(967)-C(5))-methyltransferase RsmB [Archangium sp.]|nr:16S rRNA (cytosine(967)-C(5))-methyltransferase RsmB [Archangium sp.]